MHQLSTRLVPVMVVLLGLVSLGLIAFVLIGRGFAKNETLAVVIAVTTALLVNLLKHLADRKVERKR
jgi:hypothetical protein